MFSINSRYLILSLVALVAALAMFTLVSNNNAFAQEPARYDSECIILNGEFLGPNELELQDLTGANYSRYAEFSGAEHSHQLRQPAWKDTKAQCPSLEKIKLLM